MKADHKRGQRTASYGRRCIFYGVILDTEVLYRSFFYWYIRGESSVGLDEAACQRKNKRSIKREPKIKHTKMPRAGAAQPVFCLVFCGQPAARPDDACLHRTKRGGMEEESNRTHAAWLHQCIKVQMCTRWRPRPMQNAKEDEKKMGRCKQEKDECNMVCNMLSFFFPLSSPIRDPRSVPPVTPKAILALSSLTQDRQKPLRASLFFVWSLFFVVVDFFIVIFLFSFSLFSRPSRPSCSTRRCRAASSTRKSCTCWPARGQCP